MGRRESNQTNKQKDDIFRYIFFLGALRVNLIAYLDLMVLVAISVQPLEVEGWGAYWFEADHGHYDDPVPHCQGGRPKSKRKSVSRA